MKKIRLCEEDIVNRIARAYRRKASLDTLLRIAGTHELIIDDDRFGAAAEKLRSNTHSHGDGGHNEEYRVPVLKLDQIPMTLEELKMMLSRSSQRKENDTEAI